MVKTWQPIQRARISPAWDRTRTSIFASDGHYHPAGHKVAAYQSLGLLAGFSHSVAVDPVFRSVANGWNAGVFGDIGASYLLTPRLSVGATITGAIRYTDVYEHPDGGGKRRFWELEGSPVSGLLPRCTSRAPLRALAR